MTTSTTLNKGRTSGNGVTTSFPYSIKIKNESDIVVQTIDSTTDAVVNTLVLNDGGSLGYTVSFDTDAETLTVVTVTAPITGEDLFVLRNLPLTQETDFPTASKFPASSVEDALDKNVMLMQDLQEEVDRSLKFSETSEIAGVEFPDPEANTIIGWNNAGDNLINSESAIGSSITATGSNTAREITDRFAETANVLDFGAIGDNSTDDLTAFNLALAYNTHVFIPAGTYRLSAMPSFNGNYLDAKGATLIIDDNQQSLSTKLDIRYADGLKIEGKSTYATTITSIDSVTGSSGAWTVQATVNDATNIAVGDGILIDTVRPGSGDPRGFSGRPIQGQLDEVFAKTGLLSATGTAITIAAGDEDANDVMSVGDLLIAKSQVKKIASIGATSGTVDVAYIDDFASINSFFSCRPNAGTVSVSGTAVTGVGTNFFNEGNVGDLFVVNGCGVGVIQSIASNTIMTLKHKLPTVSAKEYGLVNLGERHEGIWKVTAVSGSQVSWVNTGQDATYKPPKNGITSGNITTVKTTMTSNTAIDGLKVKGQLELDKIAFFGDGVTSSTIGLDMNDANTTVTMGNFVGISGYGYNAQLADNSTLNWNKGYSTNSKTVGIDLSQASSFNGRDFISGGNAGESIMIEYGCFADLNVALLHCDGQSNARLDAGATVVSEYMRCISSGIDNVGIFGNGAVHLVGCRLFDADGKNANFSNLGDGRVTGSLMIAGDGGNLSITNARVEGTNLQAISSGSSNILISGTGSLYAPRGSTSGAVDVYGIRAIGNATASLSDFQVTFCSRGVVAEQSSKIVGDGLYSSGNTSSDYSILDSTFASIYYENGNTGGVHSPTLNEFNLDGSGHISSGGGLDSAKGDVNADTLEINSGDAVNFLKFYSQALNFGLLSVGQSETQTITSTGTLAGMVPMWGQNNAGANCNYEVEVVAGGIEVTCTNNGTAAVNPGNSTFSVWVLGG